MTTDDERLYAPRSKAELRARLVGPSMHYDQEDVQFWRSAGEQVRGQTLYELLDRGERIRASIPYIRQEPNRLILHPGRIEIQAKQ